MNKPTIEVSRKLQNQNRVVVLEIPQHWEFALGNTLMRKIKLSWWLMKMPWIDDSE